MKNQLRRDTNISLAEGFRLQWEESQSCYVLLYPEGIVTLNTSAAEILKLCDGYRSIAVIIAVLQDKYSQGRIRHLIEDTYQFLTEALQKGWLTVV